MRETHFGHDINAGIMACSAKMVTSNHTLVQRHDFLAQGHDHELCVEDALTDAERICREAGANLTTLRKLVLRLVWSGHRPVGAYEILEALSSEGRRAAPPTVYRALEFLLEHGLVHRLASLNAFAGCSNPGHAGHGQFLICTLCGSAVELNDPQINQTIQEAATRRGFVPASHTVEIAGVCPNCR
jgi:Fur family transcriptional regulator, zinc uptake regulator